MHGVGLFFFFPCFFNSVDTCMLLEREVNNRIFMNASITVQLLLKTNTTDSEMNTHCVRARARACAHAHMRVRPSCSQTSSHCAAP